MILDFDAGNTRVKWRVLREQGGDVLDSDAFNFNSDDELSYALKNIYQNFKHICYIRVASVRGEQFDQLFYQACFKQFNVQAKFAAVKTKGFAIEPAYDDPNQLGVDRWLSMLAAYTVCRKSCAVVSLGSALTLDLVDDKGSHLGGYILPGIRSMQRVLGYTTHAVKVDALNCDGDIAPGKSTVTCVRNGLSLMLKSFIYEAVTLAEFSPPVSVFASGGDAGFLSRQLYDRQELKIEVYCNLVFEGLAIALPLP